MSAAYFSNPDDWSVDCSIFRDEAACLRFESPTVNVAAALTGGHVWTCAVGLPLDPPVTVPDEKARSGSPLTKRQE